MRGMARMELVSVPSVGVQLMDGVNEGVASCE